MHHPPPRSLAFVVLVAACLSSVAIADGSCSEDSVEATFSCVDLPCARSGATWNDGKNGCAQFEKFEALGDRWCMEYGSHDLNGEGTAQDKCCTCGGGRRPEPRPVHFQDASDIPPKCQNPSPDFPNLDYAKYREQPWFHQINLTLPNVQLVHEEPYIFIVDDFLTERECELLIKKAEVNLKKDEFNTRGLEGYEKGGTRTSSRSITKDSEVMPLRHKIAALTNLEVAQIQHLKLSKYDAGDLISVHTDAQPGALPLTLESNSDSNNDGGRSKWGVKGDNRPGQNRFLTVLTYLNDVESGGRTNFKWTCYDVFEPKEVGTHCKEFYDKPFASHGKSAQNGSGPPWEFSVSPKRGRSIVFFPATTADTGGYTDYNVLHQGEAPGSGSEKYVVQAFTWSRPVLSGFKDVVGSNDWPPKHPLTDTIV